MLLDTDVLIDLERRHPAADAWLSGLVVVPEVPGFAAMEILNGCRSKLVAPGVPRKQSLAPHL